MPSVNSYSNAPETFGGDITWTATNPYAVFGYTGGYGFAGNGDWNGALGAMAGLNTTTGTMTFSFADPVSGFGGFMNYVPDDGPAVISAYNSSGVLIEDYTLTFNTGGGTNTGEFLGFQDSTADISKFTLSGAVNGVTQLEVSHAAAVPETASPAVLALALASLAGFGLLSKRNARLV